MVHQLFPNFPMLLFQSFISQIPISNSSVIFNDLVSPFSRSSVIFHDLVSPFSRLSVKFQKVHQLFPLSCFTFQSSISQIPNGSSVISHDLVSPFSRLSVKFEIVVHQLLTYDLVSPYSRSSVKFRMDCLAPKAKCDCLPSWKSRISQNNSSRFLRSVTQYCTVLYYTLLYSIGRKRDSCSRLVSFKRFDTDLKNVTNMGSVALFLWY